MPLLNVPRACVCPGATRKDVSLLLQAATSRKNLLEYLSQHADILQRSVVNPAASCCRELGASGCKSLLAVPISFVSEHIETLEEIDMEYRELAHESGIPGWGRVPALNTNPTFIDDLADAVLEALPYAGSMAGSNPSDSMVPLGERLCCID